MTKYISPFESIMRQLLPTPSEKLMNRLRYLERTSLPQTLSGLQKHGVNPSTIEALRRVRTASQVPECVFTTVVVDQLFEMMDLDYEAQESVCRYLDRKLRNTQSEVIGKAVQAVLKRNLSRIAANDPSPKASSRKRRVRWIEPKAA